jgi:hypothetical protein
MLQFSGNLYSQYSTTWDSLFRALSAQITANSCKSLLWPLISHTLAGLLQDRFALYPVGWLMKLEAVADVDIQFSLEQYLA